MASADEVRPTLTRSAAPVSAPEGDDDAAFIDGVPAAGHRRSVHLFLQSSEFQAISMACTFYALFVPDVCHGFLSADADVPLVSFGLTVVFFFFILESIASVASRPKTVCEMFFYLDVVATLSLIAVRARDLPEPPRQPPRRSLRPWRCSFRSVLCFLVRSIPLPLAGRSAQDILWIQEALAGDETVDDQLTLTRSARLARVGARAARLARMARILRVMKLMKLMLLVKMRRNVPMEDEEDLDSVPKTIQDSVSERVTRRVVMIVLFSVIGSAGLQYYEEDLAANAAFMVIAAASNSSFAAQTTAVAEAVPAMYFLEITTFGVDTPLIDRRNEQQYLDLRASETTKYVTGPDDACANCKSPAQSFAGSNQAPECLGYFFDRLLRLQAWHGWTTPWPRSRRRC
jgi:hypothetical protein